MTSSVDLDAHPASPDGAPLKPSKYAWLREVAIVLGFYYIYEGVRSFADRAGITNVAYANARRLVEWEESLHIFHEQAIQHFFITATWFIKLMNIYYGTLHFVITVGLLVWMYRKRHEGYRELRNLLGLITSLALFGYYLFPLAPPRLYKCNNNIPVPGPDGYTVGKCFVDTLDKVGGLWSYHSPVAKAVANQYAAMPSLHFAWALWCGIVLFRFGRHRSTRVMAFVYPFLTLFAIVVTANHWFLDALGGTIIVLAALWITRMHQRWLSRRRLQRARSLPSAPSTA
jgi:small-conductance mechanosensitive channel